MTIEQTCGALNDIPMGMCLINKDVRVLFGNECLEGWTHMARADMVGEEFGQGTTFTFTLPVTPVEVPV
ncbi:MAG: hypothetical protein O7F12_15720 [Nitrospirae bacterium]|nr:hypothetical protein [Nitrospirota bacterium]